MRLRRYPPAIPVDLHKLRLPQSLTKKIHFRQNCTYLCGGTAVPILPQIPLGYQEPICLPNGLWI